MSVNTLGKTGGLFNPLCRMVQHMIGRLFAQLRRMLLLILGI